ncbi:protein kinase domain-containing protein [Actinophytocola sediminis]
MGERVEGLRQDDPDRIGGYWLLGRLGEGGMGVVYLARSPGGRTVAVKVIRERFAADPQFRARFRREAAAAVQVASTVTAPVLDADPDAATPWLVTAYLTGVTLREAVAGHGPLPPATVQVVAAGLGEALAEIHGIGMTHRDIKPSNVMLTADGPRLIDFGIARPQDATAITAVGTIIGTPGYMAPEQALGQPAGPAADVFATGAVLAYATTGRPPFGAGDTSAILDRVERVEADLAGFPDPRLYQVVTACLARDPAARPDAAALVGMAGAGTHGPHWLPAAVREEIDRRGATDPTALPDPQPTSAAQMELATADPVVVRSTPRRRTLLIAGGATAAAAAVAAGIALLGDRDERDGTASPTAPPATEPPPTTTSTPPPAAIRSWRTKVSDYYPQVYAAGGVVMAVSQEDRVHALEPGSGKVLWTTPATLIGRVDNGRVFAAENANPVLRAFTPRTGAVRWSYRPPLAEIIVRLVDTTAVTCFGFHALRALDSATGAPRWTAAVDTQNGLAARGGLIVAAAETALTAVAADTGGTRWTYPIDEPFYLAVGDREVFATDRNGTLHAIAAATGVARWRQETVMVASTPVPVGDVVYLGGGRGEVLALDAATGTRRWARAYGRDCVVGHADGVLYASTGDTVQVLDATDGATMLTYEGDLDRESPPTAVGGTLYVGTRDGAVEALTPPGGARAGS